MLRKLCLLALLLAVLAPAAALAEEAVDYDGFSAVYAENLAFLNENTGRYLLPLIPESARDSANRLVYAIEYDMLTLNVRLGADDATVEEAVVTLTAPEGMAYGDDAHTSFTAYGYQCYALLMAMSAESEASDRYALVTRLDGGLSAGNSYFTQEGAYAVTCERIGHSVVFSFSLGESEAPIDEEMDLYNEEEGDYIG